MDTNPGRGEQVIDHYLPGAVTNYERKNYRKNYIKLHKIPLKFEKDFKTESTINNSKSQAQKRGKKKDEKMASIVGANG